MTLADEIEVARGRLAALERQAATATCQEIGCDMQHVGGTNAGCADYCSCSVPVHRCSRCGDYDYGQNPEADQKRAECAAGDDGGDW
jgi:hypothetical protein